MLQLLMLHYDRCAKYYGSTSGQGMYGASSDEEKRLTMMLFSNIFDSLSKMVICSLNFRINCTNQYYNRHLIHLLRIKCCKAVTSVTSVANSYNIFILRRTMIQSCLEKHFHAWLPLVVLCRQTTLSPKIMMMNGTAQRQVQILMVLITHSLSTPAGNLLYILQYCNRGYVSHCHST